MKRSLFLMLSLVSRVAFAQYQTEHFSNEFSLQYGVSLKGLLEFGFKRGHNPDYPHPPTVIYRITANAGIGSNFLDSWLYPTFNGELQLYNGGIGSRTRRDAHRQCTLDFIAAFTFTAGWKNYFTAQNDPGNPLKHRNVPLYYFADFGYPALQNPYRYSASIGTNVVLSTNKKRAPQRIGFVGFHASRWQISSYNDGGQPFRFLQIGDRADRYYTGGGVLSYHGDTYTQVNLIELSYHKFTGYTKNAFELSNELQLPYVNYRDKEQKYFNKSLWTLNIANLVRGVGVNLRAYNFIHYDIQHLLHWGLFNSYHLVPYKPHWSINGVYYYTANQIGLQ